MAGRGGGSRKVLLPPINFIFRLLQSRTTVSIWLYEQLTIRIEGKIRVCSHHSYRANDSNVTFKGFDEFMNLVIDDAYEVKLKPKEGEDARRKLGQYLALPRAGSY